MYIHPHCLLVSMFSNEASAVTPMKDLCMWCAASFICSRILLLPGFSLSFNSLTVMCIAYFFEFILLGFCWAACICKLILFIKFGKCFVSVSLNSFTFFSLSFLSWDIHYVYIVRLAASGRSVRLCLFSFFFFFFFLLYILNSLLDLYSDSLILSSSSSKPVV